MTGNAMIDADPCTSKGSDGYREEWKICEDCGLSHPRLFVTKHHSPKIGTYYVCHDCMNSGKVEDKL